MNANTESEIRRIYERWHETVRDRDYEGTLALYADDAIFETPLALAVGNIDGDGEASGVLKGKIALRRFFEAGSRKLSSEFARWYRTGTFFSNGQQLTWEYPRETPQGDQIDLVEMMDIANGHIVHHRVYWGWFGYRMLLKA